MPRRLLKTEKKTIANKIRSLKIVIYEKSIDTGWINELINCNEFDEF